MSRIEYDEGYGPGGGGGEARERRAGPRDALGYRSRGGKVVLRVTYQAIARADGRITTAGVKKAVQRRQLDPGDLASLARWLEERRRKREPKATPSRRRSTGARK